MIPIKAYGELQMDLLEVKKEIKELIIEIADDMDKDVGMISDDTHFIDDLELDSMALLEVLSSMEKKFKVQIPEDEFPNLTTINKCTETVAKYLKD